MVKWQYIAGLSGVTAFMLFAGLLNLSGVKDISYSNDSFCAEQCDAMIQFNSTYWSYCFEHAGEQGIVFKKSARSRTLWVNLDKVVFTEPRIKTAIQVPTTGNRWRDIKDGDCTTRNKLSRFRILGNKTPEQTIKWSWVIEDYTSEDIKIDPTWYGFGVVCTKSDWGEISKYSAYYVTIPCDIENKSCTKSIISKRWNFTRFSGDDPQCG